MSRLRIVLLAVLLLVLVILPACATSATPTPAAPTAAPGAPAVSPEWQKVVETANKEGTITIYVAIGRFQEAVSEQFPRQTGIAAQIITLDAAQAREKVRVEQQASAVTADLLVSAITTNTDIIGWGYAQSVPVELPVERDKAVFRLDPWQYDDGRRQLLTWAQETNPSILINTKLVKEEEIQSWNDLLDPKWKGKIIITDPRFPGGSVIMAYAASELGQDYWKKLAGQSLRFERSGSRVVQAVALGEKAVAIFPMTSFTEEAILSGAPVKFVHLKEGSMLITYAASIIRGAPHPKAATLFLNWLLSKQGHETTVRALKWAGNRKDLEPAWLEIAEMRPGAPQRVFSKVGTSSAHAQEAMAFMRQALGQP